MGLFGRGKERDERIRSLTAELATLKGQLEQSEAERSRLAAQVDHVGAASQRMVNSLGNMASTVEGLDGRLDQVDGKISTVDGRVSAVDGRISSFDGRVAGVDGLAAELRQAFESLNDRNEVTETRLQQLGEAFGAQTRQFEDVVLVAAETARRVDDLPPGGPNPDDAAAAAAETEQLRSEVSKIAERMGALDSRVNQVSVELTNQLTELSRDLDELHRHAAAEAAANGTVDIDADTSQAINDLVEERLAEIVDGQTRLAAEQTRYEIQFRSDLAELAERLRRR
ncbi:MAG: hypothetical protein AAGD33_22785 [Actinomycetota bacterium]